jgi:hypothetical protein
MLRLRPHSPRASDITEGNAARLSRVHERSILGPRPPAGLTRAEITDRDHRSSALVRWSLTKLLDNLPTPCLAPSTSTSTSTSSCAFWPRHSPPPSGSTCPATPTPPPTPSSAASSTHPARSSATAPASPSKSTAAPTHPYSATPTCQKTLPSPGGADARSTSNSPDPGAEVPVRKSALTAPGNHRGRQAGCTGMHARLSGSRQARTRDRRGPSVAVRGKPTVHTDRPRGRTPSAYLHRRGGGYHSRCVKE